ncbi:MAG: hypothetical protein IPK16_25575 [Anaerolineales bacterium]|nr:hypothetical protein [Anaerolineales bacterium]
MTDASGVPLAGEHDLKFRLFSASAGGTKRWGDEVHNNVPVSKGLFQVVLGSTVALDPATLFDEQLYLEVEVDGNVLPRQMLHAAPYAMALTAGAQVRGATSSATQYGLTVMNSTGKGIYADANGDNIDAIYSTDRIYSDEGYSGPDTYVWLPVQNMVLKSGSVGDADILVNTFSDVSITANVAGTVDVIVPVQLERPYGRNYQVEEMVIYYRTNSPHSMISDTWLLGRDFSTGTALSVLYDGANQTATAYSSYTVTPASPFLLSTTQMATNVQLRFDMDDVSGSVTIYGIRLRLGSRY